MTKRTILLIAALVLLLSGGALYYWTFARPAAAAADCAEKPKPKDEFAMAAECDAGEMPPGGAAAPATPR
jgi:flagellar basal body-associated protein FliL